MRVLLSRRHRDERGAVAIMMAVSAVLLCVIAAFVVDFGQAYANKGQAQVAADAAALAAGKVYGGQTGTCDALATNTALEQQALLQADPIREQNLVHSTHIPGDLATCEADTLKIHYEVSYDSPLGLGSLVTGTDHMTVDRQATVALGAAENTVGSLRPWMICGAQLPPGPAFENKVVEIGFPTNGHKPPPAGSCTADQAGDWWVTSCNGAPNGNQSVTYNSVLNGCDKTSLAPLSTPPPATPATLGDALLRDCNTSTSTPPKQNGPWVDSTYCMKRDTGYNVKTIAPAWQTLLGKTVAMPVFCDVPQCSPSSLLTGSNGKVVSGAEWPIWKIAAVTVCGYALHGAYSPSTLPTGDCNNYNTDHLVPTAFGSSDTGFLLIFKGLIENGGQETFPTKTATTVRLVQ